jgi:hypothetical protein
MGAGRWFRSAFTIQALANMIDRESDRLKGPTWTGLA